MTCYLCQAEAVGRCFTCGQLFCAEHGQRDCTRCATAIAPGSSRDDRISKNRLVRETKLAWWRPQQAEDFEPPACYECKGLARTTCRNCHSLYCPEHAGVNGLCQACDRSSWLGLTVLFWLFLALGILLLLGTQWHGWR